MSLFLKTVKPYSVHGFWLCLGFLFLCSIPKPKKKQKRDKRLREQFLQLPIPQGIGYKSSRILGLEDSYLTDIAKLANEARHSQRMKNGVKCEVHNQIQGNTTCAKKQVDNAEIVIKFLIMNVSRSDCPNLKISEKTVQQILKLMSIF